jgi:hypothetical protein
MKKWFITPLKSLFSLYLIIGFIRWDLMISNWSNDDRFGLVLISLFVWILASAPSGSDSSVSTES